MAPSLGQKASSPERGELGGLQIGALHLLPGPFWKPAATLDLPRSGRPSPVTLVLTTLSGVNVQGIARLKVPGCQQQKGYFPLVSRPGHPICGIDYRLGNYFLASESLRVRLYVMVRRSQR